MSEFKDMTNEEIITRFMDALMNELRVNSNALALIACIKELDDPAAKIAGGLAWQDAGAEMRVTFRSIPKKRGQKKKQSRCESCDKAKADVPHSCPYKEEIHDDSKTLCTCCPSCKADCALEI